MDIRTRKGMVVCQKLLKRQKETVESRDFARAKEIWHL